MYIIRYTNKIRKGVLYKQIGFVAVDITENKYEVADPKMMLVL